MESIIQKERECYLCGRSYPLHRHHVLHGFNRKKADQDGLTVYLCIDCHIALHQLGFHDRELKKVAQEAWEHRYGTTEDFVKRYGKNYK